MNHRTNHGHKDKKTARRNLPNEAPCVSKDKTASTSGIHRPIQRGESAVPTSIETELSVQAVEEVVRKKHKLPKTLEEAMLMNRASVLLLSVPDSDTEIQTDNDLPLITTEGQAEQESLLDCSITSIHIAEGRHRSKQRMVLPGENADPGIHMDDPSSVDAIEDGASACDEASDSEKASSQFGSIPFYLPATTDRDEVSIVFKKPFINTQYVVTANASVPGVMVAVTKRQRHSAVLTVEREHSGSTCEGVILWIAMGY
ncbi:WIAG-tail domain [Paenibacillus sp. Aloe-11]|uniref:WIAG-tail domain n=1 Tax=Paenibacillus sp. Aloe-11 TaxID=1050222 RepID=UPI00024EF786|nr:WIAG-tail domain [Paenibacillus sp. Aloe-11]EHS56272.1 hypothetical protein WG8_3893 [Paenibacillus sp. Aloe-11]